VNNGSGVVLRVFHIILNRRKNYFCQILNVELMKDDGQTSGYS